MGGLLKICRWSILIIWAEMRLVSFWEERRCPMWSTWMVLWIINGKSARVNYPSQSIIPYVSRLCRSFWGLSLSGFVKRGLNNGKTGKVNQQEIMWFALLFRTTKRWPVSVLSPMVQASPFRLAGHCSWRLVLTQRTPLTTCDRLIQFHDGTPNLSSHLGDATVLNSKNTFRLLPTLLVSFEY